MPLEDYLKKGDEIANYQYQEFLKKPTSEAVQRLRKIQTEREAAKSS